MMEYQGEFTVREMCRVLKVRRSGFYAFLKRPVSLHAFEDEALGKRIRQVFAARKGLPV